MQAFAVTHYAAERPSSANLSNGKDYHVEPRGISGYKMVYSAIRNERQRDAFGRQPASTTLMLKVKEGLHHDHRRHAHGDMAATSVSRPAVTSALRCPDQNGGRQVIDLKQFKVKRLPVFISATIGDKLCSPPTQKENTASVFPHGFPSEISCNASKGAHCVNETLAKLKKTGHGHPVSSSTPVDRGQENQNFLNPPLQHRVESRFTLKRPDGTRRKLNSGPAASLLKLRWARALAGLRTPDPTADRQRHYQYHAPMDRTRSQPGG